jgi:hypothetical protein
MIWTVVGVLFVFGVLLIVYCRWAGLVYGAALTTAVLWLYGYPTTGWFLPDDFDLLYASETVVLIEEPDARAPRAVTLDPVPPEWRAAMEDGDGQPVRIMRRPGGKPTQFPANPTKWFGPHTEGLSVIDEYRMQKP